MPFSFGPHAHTEGTHFLWLLLFAYTLPLSSCLLALTSCQTDRGFMPTRWQVSDGKALRLKKTLRPLSPSLSLRLPAPPPPSFVCLSVSLLFSFQPSARFQRSNETHQASSLAFFFFLLVAAADVNHLRRNRSVRLNLRVTRLPSSPTVAARQRHPLDPRCRFRY